MTIERWHCFVCGTDAEFEARPSYMQRFARACTECGEEMTLTGKPRQIASSYREIRR